MDSFFNFVEGLNNKPNQVAARQAAINVRYKEESAWKEEDEAPQNSLASRIFLRMPKTYCKRTHLLYHTVPPPTHNNFLHPLLPLHYPPTPPTPPRLQHPIVYKRLSPSPTSEGFRIIFFNFNHFSICRRRSRLFSPVFPPPPHSLCPTLTRRYLCI